MALREVILVEKELEEWLKLHKFYMAEYRTIDLAKYLKVSPRTIQRWLKGKIKPKSEQLAQIKKYLGSLNSESEESAESL